MAIDETAALLNKVDCGYDKETSKVMIKNEEVYCPYCKKYLFEEEFIWDFEDYKFCPYCGERIIIKEGKKSDR